LFADPKTGSLSLSNSARPGSVTTSTVFHFIIGPRGQAFRIHSVLLARQSPVFRRLISYPLNYGGYDIDDVEERTFSLFLQFAYTRNYGPSISFDLSLWRPLEYLHEREASGEDGQPAAKTVKLSAHKSLVRRLDEFFADQGLAMVLGDVARVHEATIPQDRGEIDLVSHAKLFVFADSWEIDLLRRLSLRKLAKELEEFTSEGDGEVEELVALLEYTFSEPRPELLQSLCNMCAAYHFKDLWKSERFKGIFSQYAALHRGMMDVVADSQELRLS